MGIVPACFTTLDWLRVESYLLFYPYDMSQMYPFEHDKPGDSLWELGLDFTVSPGKNDFRGADAHERLKGKERFKIFGLLVDGKVAADMGDPVYSGDKKVGVITCAMFSSLDRQIDGDRAPRRTCRGARDEAANSRQERQGAGHGAYPAVRRSRTRENVPRSAEGSQHANQAPDQWRPYGAAKDRSSAYSTRRPANASPKCRRRAARRWTRRWPPPRKRPPGWAQTVPKDRAALLLRLADRIEAEAPRIAKLESDNTGKPLARGLER